MAKSKKASKTATQPKIPEKTIFEWVAPEYIEHNKGEKWYLIAGITALIAAALAAVTGNWTLALAIITFAAVYYYISRHHPAKNIKITVSDMGIRVGHMFFPYNNIKAFWIFYDHGIKTLNLRISNRSLTDIVIQLNDQDPTPLRQFLVGQVPEWEGKQERLSDIILRLLKL